MMFLVRVFLCLVCSCNSKYEEGDVCAGCLGENDVGCSLRFVQFEDRNVSFVIVVRLFKTRQQQLYAGLLISVFLFKQVCLCFLCGVLQ